MSVVMPLDSSTARVVAPSEWDLGPREGEVRRARGSRSDPPSARAARAGPVPSFRCDMAVHGNAQAPSRMSPEDPGCPGTHVPGHRGLRNYRVAHGLAAAWTGQGVGPAPTYLVATSPCMTDP